MFRKRFVPAAAVAALACCVSAHAVELVRDINATLGASSSTFLGIRAELSPAVALMVLNDGVRGSELWVTDGTPAGTRLLRDINPGPADSGITSFVVINRIAHFIAMDGTNGAEVWRSDGTAAGTFIVANIGPGSADLGPRGPSELIKLNDILYFIGDDGSGNELWRSDGTRTGTWRVMDIRPGAEGSEPENLLVAGSRLFFRADDGTTGREVWSSDGTPGGTRRVADIFQGSFGSGFGVGLILGSTLFFNADDDRHGQELWRAPISGTSAAMVVDLETTPQTPADPRTQGSFPNLHGVVGNRLLLTARKLETRNSRPTSISRLYAVTETAAQLTPIFEYDQFEGPTTFLFNVAGRMVFHRFNKGVWVTDGTAAGTFALQSGGLPLHIDELTAPGASLATPAEAFFYARLGPVANAPINLWRTDGTTAGTFMQAQMPDSFLPDQMIRFGGRIYFRGGSVSDEAGPELWVTDTTALGAQRVVDLNPGAQGSDVRAFGVVLGRLMFVARTEATGYEPYVSDGTTAGTVRLGDVNGTIITPSSHPHSLRAFGSRVLLFADDGINGQEMWSSDGTAVGTQLVADLAPGAVSLQAPQWVGEVPGGLLFTANDGIAGRELWITDGTAGGTRRVADIAPGPASSNPAGFGAIVTGGIAYFEADDGNGQELWVSDGTTAGTRMVVALIPNDQNSSLLMIGAVNGRLVFRVRPGSQDELWVSDGTPGGTLPLRRGIEAHFTVANVEVGGFLYFSATENGTAQLWRTDGTPAGTTQVTTSGEELSADWFARAGSTLVLRACNQSCGLYSSDGTDAGTIRLLDGSPSNFVNDGALTYFQLTRDGRTRLYVTDGTLSGTRDFLPPRTTNLTPYDFVPLGGSVFFVVDPPGGGPQVWHSDGTAEGTGTYTTFTDAAGGLTRLGTRVLLVGGDVATGRELYVIMSDRPFAWNDEAATVFQTGVTIAVLSNDATIDAPLNGASVEIVAPPSNGSVAIAQATGAITYTPDNDFSGLDTFTYRVSDTLGVASNAARVSITVATPAGNGPGTAPQPPPPPPPPSNGGNGGGGGGSIGALCLLLLGLALWSRAAPEALQLPTSPKLLAVRSFQRRRVSHRSHPEPR